MGLSPLGGCWEGAESVGGLRGGLWGLLGGDSVHWGGGWRGAESIGGALRLSGGGEGRCGGPLGGLGRIESIGKLNGAFWEQLGVSGGGICGAETPQGTILGRGGADTALPHRSSHEQSRAARGAQSCRPGEGGGHGAAGPAGPMGCWLGPLGSCWVCGVLVGPIGVPLGPLRSRCAHGVLVGPISFWLFPLGSSCSRSVPVVPLGSGGAGCSRCSCCPPPPLVSLRLWQCRCPTQCPMRCPIQCPMRCPIQCPI